MTLPAALMRPFRIIAFDWDGTAVAGRSDDASAVRQRIERLLRAGVQVVVITGTKLANVDAQLSAAILGPHKRRLYIATNRGSEVYGFDARSQPELIDKRVASPAEDQLLTTVADALAAELEARTGLDIQVIYDRLNRRKIDLIALPQWRDPPKSALGALQDAVERRLCDAGLTGGLREAFALAQALSTQHGLASARITSDVKHIEIGLTDKTDSVRWLLRSLAAGLSIPASEILIAGDEFGPIAGFSGSDAMMLVPEAAAATYVSVGPEPAGAPAPVLHLGGGPACFVSILGAQAALHPVVLRAAPTRDESFRLVEEGFSLLREHEIESLFAVGNGYVGSRGSLAEGSSLSFPATFVAGVFDLAPGPYRVPEFAPMPDWSHVSAHIDGKPLRMESGAQLEHRRVLDLRAGSTYRHWRQRDAEGRVTRICGVRLVSMADRHLMLQSISFTPENYGGRVMIEPSIFAPVIQSTAAGVTTAFLAATILEQPEAYQVVAGERVQALTMEVDVEAGKSYRLDRVVSVYTSRDTDDPRGDADRHLRALLASRSPEDIVEAHQAAWRALWEVADLRIEGDDEAQRAIRFAIHHLLSSANPDDEGVSIGARALTGAAYKGHVFWDTEMFMLPFFTITQPRTARALLMYRFKTLPGARARAAQFGHAGALYAWESADTGEDVTPPFVLAPDGEIVPILCGTKEQHISADVAYAVWQYWQWTGDDEFLCAVGAEIVLETARFWASRVQAGEDGCYHIHDVVGPDEYHESVDDSAYTNGMAQWNLERGAEVAELLAQRWPDSFRALCSRIALREDEPREWSCIARDMYTGLSPETGVFEQFRGYHQLEHIDLSRFASREQNMDVLLGRERVQRSQIIKQADVVMLIHLLWERFTPEVREANFRYYEPRTDHGSSLSPSVHALVAARLGDLALAEHYFRRTAEIDLANNMGNAAGGVHAAAQGGLWQAVVFGFMGLELGASGPTFSPKLPEHWKRVDFAAHYRGRRFHMDTGRRAGGARSLARDTSP